MYINTPNANYRNTIQLGPRGGKFLAVFVGLVFFVVGGWILYSHYQFSKIAIPATGTVVRIQQITDSRNNIKYAPVIMFKTADNREIVFQEKNTNTYVSYPTSSTVRILYNPNIPENAEIAGATTNIMGGVFAGLGLIVFLLGLFGKIQTTDNPNNPGPNGVVPPTQL